MNDAGARDGGALVGSAVVEGDWEYQPVRLPPDVTRISATVQLGIRAEFGGWELARTLLYADGTRKVWLRRRLSRSLAAGLAT
ncbi:DUF5703 family protein [Actinomycetospora straminea]|uniref:Dihydroorotate dehydrogenase n=1 Tax=Actinomycetospora straminea TaxID=663607 RepID=A0ABP9DVB8_9PSEU|nr:DUF5703 family protein [Actinomycetospora straminea]